MSDKQMKLFGAEAKPKFLVESNEQGKVGAGDALKPTEKIEPRPLG